jgi:hypothetical protein
MLKSILSALFTCKQELEVLMFYRKNTFSERMDQATLAATERILALNVGTGALERKRRFRSQQDFRE